RQLRRGERLVAGAEVDRALLDLGDAAAGTDRLVVDLVAGGGVVVRGPARHQRIDEGRPGAGDPGGARRAGAGVSRGRAGGGRLAAGGGQRSREQEGGKTQGGDGHGGSGSMGNWRPLDGPAVTPS